MFFLILLIGIALVVIQGICAYYDGYLTQAQMHAQGLFNGYSFMEHGGMWSDVFVISPLVAYVTTKYRLGYTSWYSLLILVIAIVVTVGAGIAYNKIGLSFPVAHSHNGKTTPAGWIHGAFAVAVMWIGVMFYLTPIVPKASARDILFVASLLTPFSFLGLYNFSSRWVFLPGAKIQFAAQVIVLWTVTVVKLVYA
jgi:hypothetical protein